MKSNPILSWILDSTLWTPDEELDSGLDELDSGIFVSAAWIQDSNR